MERRVLLAVFLSFLVLYGYQALVGPPPPSGDDGVAAVATPTAFPEVGPAGGTAPDNRPLIPRSSPSTSETQASATEAAAVAPAAEFAPEPVIGDTVARDVVVDGESFRAVFSNRGAELISWQLKDYLEDGQPVELIPRDLPAEEPWPFALLFEEEDVTRRAHTALYRSSHREIYLEDRAETLVFEFEDATGLSVTKRFTFDPGRSPYVVATSVEARLAGELLSPTIRWGPAVGGVERSSSGIAYLQGPRGLIRGRVRQGDGLSDLDVIRPDASDLATQSVYDGQFDYVGVDNHYFIAVALPQLRDGLVRYRAVPLPPIPPDEDPRDLMAFDMAFSAGETEISFFIGPKDFDVLGNVMPTLSESIDFGWLSVLVVPLHRSLKWVHGWVGNYGFSIIIVTLLINIIILPLRHKSVVSMRKMQEIQPEMKAIQDRYAHLKATNPDKQNMNKEVMELYRQRGVNPVSGCLPMLLTMPILFAFYRLLSMSIELRGAPFVGWISDLSLHDPFYITPLIMGGSMVLQQRLQPSQADPMQQRIMMLMPVVFTFMFLWAPSGLVIYWLTSNLIGIGQQLATNRLIGPPKQRVVRPAAERRVTPKKIKAQPPKPVASGNAASRKTSKKRGGTQ